MTYLSAVLVRLGAICVLAAMSDIVVSGTKLKSGMMLISGLLMIEAILSLCFSLLQEMGWKP